MLIKKCRHGEFLYNENDVYIGKSLEFYGEYSEGEVDLFRSCINSGDIVIEAGSNIGAHTIPLSRIVGTLGAVLAFEVQPQMYYNLCGNLALNKITNTRPFLMALGAESGMIKVPLVDCDKKQNFGGFKIKPLDNGFEVIVRTIDQLNIAKVDFLKMDVEGMETDILLGANETIRKNRPIIYCENAEASSSEKLIDDIFAFDYRAYWHAPKLYAENNFFNIKENVFGETVSLNMLCVPNEKPHKLEEKFEITQKNKALHPTIHAIIP